MSRTFKHEKTYGPRDKRSTWDKKRKKKRLIKKFPRRGGRTENE